MTIPQKKPRRPPIKPKSSQNKNHSPKQNVNHALKSNPHQDSSDDEPSIQVQPTDNEVVAPRQCKCAACMQDSIGFLTIQLDHPTHMHHELQDDFPDPVKDPAITQDDVLQRVVMFSKIANSLRQWISMGIKAGREFDDRRIR